MAAVEQVEDSAIAGCPRVSLSDPREECHLALKRDLFGNPTGQRGIEPQALRYKSRALTPGPPEKSLLPRFVEKAQKD